ncbi:DoxX family membrane protein [Agrilactobacillus fermenti]|uniref:DoxX family membrane protein n=1 Tax=Agrilactobacillus fermenti TaxID=2586909 RepID=UPI001E3807CC|nr:DoxX family membrane protein [Agrilactobacillus fermenti]MCD2256429.1 DoxX family membrane protein [Agrilactobacillus fermenti]
MVNWLRNNKIAMWILTIMRIYLGYEWILDGWGKVSKGFDASGFIMNAIKHPVPGPHGPEAVYPMYTSFLKSFVQPNISFFNFAVSWGELLVGIGLLLGAFTTAASFFAILMNFSYLLAGTVSVNPKYVIFEIFFLIAGVNAGKIGLDRWIIPFLRRKLPFLKGDPDLKHN